MEEGEKQARDGNASWNLGPLYDRAAISRRYMELSTIFSDSHLFSQLSS